MGTAHTLISVIRSRTLGETKEQAGLEMPNETSLEPLLVLTGLHPSGQHCDLVMHDFNQEFVVARVLKPLRKPSPGTLMPVLTRVDLTSEDIRSRLHRRLETGQHTDFSLNGVPVTGRIVQIEYRREQALAEDAVDVEVLMFVIECVTCS